MSPSDSSNRSIYIGGNATGSTIISGSGNNISGNNNQVNIQVGASGASQATAHENTARRKILILAANPKQDKQRLDEEVRDITEGLKRAKNRETFEIRQRWAVQPRDLQRAMLEEAPHIVHFAGHGAGYEMGEAGLHLDTVTGESQPVTGEALAALFKLFAMKTAIECVVLNGCYEAAQAAGIAAHVPHVVGMASGVEAQAAIEFAVGFYDALGNGESVDFAFESGKVAMALNGAVAEPVMLKAVP